MKHHRWLPRFVSDLLAALQVVLTVSLYMTLFFFNTV